MVNAAYRLSNYPYRCTYSVLVHLCRRKPICLRTRHARRLSNIWFVFRKWHTGNNQMPQDIQPTDCCEVDQQILSVCLPAYLSCLTVCLSVSLCLSQTYVALWPKLDLFRQRCPQVKTPRIVQYKESMWWWRFRITQVIQVISALDQCSEGFELEQQNLLSCLSVCLAVTN